VKIDINNPFHWLYLIAFTLNIAAAAVLRPLLRRQENGHAMLYGHKSN